MSVLLARSRRVEHKEHTSHLNSKRHGEQTPMDRPSIPRHLSWSISHFLNPRSSLLPQHVHAEVENVVRISSWEHIRAEELASCEWNLLHGTSWRGEDGLK